VIETFPDTGKVGGKPAGDRRVGKIAVCLFGL
jgi:hypothetical protein